MNALLYQCMTKATTAEGDQRKLGLSWAFSRRAQLKVYEHCLVCGDWTILHDQIRDAALYSVRSTLFIPGYILRIQTDQKTYHFGLNRGRFWQGELPFPVRREKAKLRYSAVSLFARCFLVVYGLLLLWRWLN